MNLLYAAPGHRAPGGGGGAEPVRRAQLSAAEVFLEAAALGLSVPLELAAIRAALALLPELPAGCYLSLNVSPATVADPGLPAVLSDVPAERIVLELTEHAPVLDYEQLAGQLAPLRRRGMRLAVDDAGAGFASLRHTVALNPDLIKLDLDLVRGLHEDANRQALVAAFTRCAEELGAALVAEGVKTAGQLQALRRFGVPFAQEGYHLGRPEPLADQPWLRRQPAAPAVRRPSPGSWWAAPRVGRQVSQRRPPDGKGNVARFTPRYAQRRRRPATPGKSLQRKVGKETRPPVHSHGNTLKTVALLGLLSALILATGRLLGGSTGLTIALVIALATNGIAYLSSDRIALRSMRARPVSEAEQPVVYRIVRELSTVARQPMPRLYVSPTGAPNAFATGRNPRHAAVCCTEGILAILDERELRGVLSHELAHVYNRDILVSSVAAGLASVVMWVANLAWFLPVGGDDEDGGNPVGAVLLLVLGPIAATVIQLAISRSREFQADASGAAATGDPLALASALRKLEVGVKALPLPPEPRLQTTSALMIANPFRSGGLGRLFSTHPPLPERIARLEEMAGYRR